MKIPAEILIRQFIRSYPEPFSLKDFSSLLAKIGVKTTAQECVEYLSTCSNVFTLTNGMYITRAFAFSNEPFSFRPTRKEFDKGVFIAGHRCMPFVDPEILSNDIDFVYKGESLKVKVVEIDSPSLLDLFFLYGEEYCVQYIASDPANQNIDLGKSDFVLPPIVHASGFSIEPLVKDGFSFGDRILCKVTDWDLNRVEVSFNHVDSSPFQMNMDDVARENWYSVLEKSLLNSFSILGPRSSIEEQLALVFIDNRNELCVKNCGSVEELFLRTKKIGFQPFGVETRLWFYGKDVPAVGKWNTPVENLSAEKGDLGGIEYDFYVETPDYLYDAYLKDQINKNIADFELICKSIHPDFYKFSQQRQKALLLHLKNRHDILVNEYNRFADFEIAPVRHEALDLYAAVNEIVHEIDDVSTDLSAFPQQPLVILSQIYSHLLHIIEMMESSDSSILKTLDEISLSLEGMEFNFDGIKDDLKKVAAEQNKNGFVVTK